LAALIFSRFISPSSDAYSCWLVATDWLSLASFTSALALAALRALPLAFFLDGMPAIVVLSGEATTNDSETALKCRSPPQLPCQAFSIIWPSSCLQCAYYFRLLLDLDS